MKIVMYANCSKGHTVLIYVTFSILLPKHRTIKNIL